MTHTFVCTRTDDNNIVLGIWGRTRLSTMPDIAASRLDHLDRKGPVSLVIPDPPFVRWYPLIPI